MFKLLIKKDKILIKLFIKNIKLKKNSIKLIYFLVELTNVENIENLLIFIKTTSYESFGFANFDPLKPS